MWPLSIYLLAIVDVKKLIRCLFFLFFGDEEQIYVGINTYCRKLAPLTKHHRRCRGHRHSGLERVLRARLRSHKGAQLVSDNIFHHPHFPRDSTAGCKEEG
jgi:hypothetical protein